MAIKRADLPAIVDDLRQWREQIAAGHIDPNLGPQLLHRITGGLPPPIVHPPPGYNPPPFVHGRWDENGTPAIDAPTLTPEERTTLLQLWRLRFVPATGAGPSDWLLAIDQALAVLADPPAQERSPVGRPRTCRRTVVRSPR